ncbi:MAG: cyclic nucleotide-binding domain-containing protein [Myxococcales bacterium]|nr:cyclic nucleotide-binding domain-containing protein [Myxococcales bacterium]
MAAESLKKLRATASMALRNGDFEQAIAGYRELEQLEPQNPIWCQRRAEIYERQGLHTQAINGFGYALGIAIDASEIITAIALCKQILEIDPSHSAALERLHSLCSDAQCPPEAPAHAAPVLSPEPELDDAPLEEMLLTEAVSGSSPDVSSADLDDPGIIEIPLVYEAPRQYLSPPDNAAPPTAREQLMNTPLFGSLDARSLSALIKRVKIVSLDEGEVLFRQGDSADTLYVVADGAVVPIAEGESRKKLAVLEAGSFFGEIGLMTNRRRNATIQAIVESRLLAIDRKAMWGLIRRHPEVLEVMLCFLRDRLVDRLIRTNPLFGSFPANQRALVAKQFRLLEVRSGTSLIEQGRVSEDLFALLAGSVHVIKMDIDSDKVLAVLEHGSIFGEMSVLEQSPAIATVVAQTKCWVLALSRDKLVRLIANNPQAEAVIKEMAEGRENQNANRSKTPVDLDGGEAP